MRRFFGVAAGAALALSVVAVAGAHPHKAKHFSAKLSGNQEVPSVTTDAKGVALFGVRRKDDPPSIHYRLAVRNIDKVTAAHIHCAKRGENGPIVVDLYPATGAEVSTTATSFSVRGEATTVRAGTMCKLRDGSSVTVNTLADVVRLMRRGLTYANVHTMDFPGGEVRGQIRHGGGHGHFDHHGKR
ncbi:MAG: CHRD domain-containing protein [Gaiellaceae bacterium]